MSTSNADLLKSLKIDRSAPPQPSSKRGLWIALAVGAALLGLTLVPASASVRRGRMGDIVETLTLLALLPLMVLASGLVSAVAG